MFSFLSKFKGLIIIVVLVVLGFIAYSKFMPKASTQQSGVVRQPGSSETGGFDVNDGPARAFVTQLLAIQSIKFNTSIFAEPTFKSLEDFSRELVPQPAGRLNPFAPLGQADIQVTSSSSGFTLTGIGTSTSTSTSSRTLRR